MLLVQERPADFATYPPVLDHRQVDLDLVLDLLRLRLLLLFWWRDLFFQIIATGRPAPDSFEGIREDEVLVVEDLRMRVGTEIVRRIVGPAPLEP